MNPAKENHWHQELHSVSVHTTIFFNADQA
jgi:hypothetical protein